MRLTRKAALVVVASLAIAGGASVAHGSPELKTMNVDLPDGSVVRVQYSGDVPPRVELRQAPVRGDLAFDPAPFLAFHRIAAEMDRQIQQLWSGRFAPRWAGWGATGPAGAGFSFVSQTTSDGRCTRSVEMTVAAPGAKPQMTKHQSGDCAAGPDARSSTRPQPGRGDGKVSDEADPPKPAPTTI
jgi:hypothetical protein